MKLHALQTGTVRVKQFQLTGASNNLSRLYQLIFTKRWSEWMPIYSWLIQTDDELILIDTGETAKIYEKGYLPSGGLYHKAVQTRIKKEEDISHQIQKIGFKLDAINTVILTHLHGDHIGGISYLPKANFIVAQAEYDMALSKEGSGNGYFPKNWPSWFKPTLISYDNRNEGIFTQSYKLNTKANIVIVPTPGHSVGHQSVIIKTKKQNYFVGGDLTYNLETLKQNIPNVVLAHKEAYASVKKAHNYVTSNSCIYLSSHDWNAPRLLADNS